MVLSSESELDEARIKDYIQPLIESFFSSPWAYCARINEIRKFTNIPSGCHKDCERWLADGR